MIFNRPFRFADPYRQQSTETPGIDIPMDKNALDRFFHAKPGKVDSMYKLFFGSPAGTVDTGQSSPWQISGEWPEKYVGPNLIRTSRIIWMMAAQREMHAWVNKIAPIVYTNAIRFDIKTKVYDDSSADLIGIGAPPTEVSSYSESRTDSAFYAGKAARIHANMLSSAEGVQELWDKLMMMALAIIKAEIMDFIQTVRASKEALIERQKYHNAKSPAKYFEMKRNEWDIVRKVRHGIEALCNYVSQLVNDYGGTLDNMIVPVGLINKLPFKTEYSVYALAGNKTSGLFNKVDKEVASIIGSAEKYDRIGLIEPIKGFKVHVLRKFISTTLNLYVNVLAHIEQIGSKHHLCNKKDIEFTNPENFDKTDLEMEVYNEDIDATSRITYSRCAKYSLAFGEDGQVRKFPFHRMIGATDDLNFDTFIKMRVNEKGEYVAFEGADPIKLIGEMNIAEDDEWSNKIVYIAKTMCNHFKESNYMITEKDAKDFKEMFDYLERLPYKNDVMDAFMTTNWEVQRVDNLGNSLYQRATLPFFRLRQVDNTGSYVLPKLVDPQAAGNVQKTVIPFGGANPWTIERIALINPDNLHSNYKKDIIKTAKKFMSALDLHVEWLRKALPECSFLKHVEQYSPGVFEFPKDTYNFSINTLKPDANFLWIKHKPFGNMNVLTPTALENFNHWLARHPWIGRDDVGRFFTSMKNNTTTPPGVRTPPGAELRPNEIAAGGLTVLNPIKAIIEGDMTVLNNTFNDLTDVRFLEMLRLIGYFQMDLNILNGNNYRDYIAPGLPGGNYQFGNYQSLTSIFNAVEPTELDSCVHLYFNLTEEMLATHNITFPDDHATMRNAPFPTYVNSVADGTGVTALARSSTTVEQFAQYMRTAGVDEGEINFYLEKCNELLRWYSIYKNSRLVAIGLLASENDYAQTTLTLNPYLRRSILKKGAGFKVQQTIFKETGGNMDVVPSPITRATPRDQNMELIYKGAMMTTNIVWSYHYNYLKRAGDLNATTHGIDELTQSYHPVNIDGQCLDVMNRAIEHEHHPFVRSSVITLCLSDCVRQNMVSLYSNGACPPVEYLIVRPHMEYELLPIIFIAGDGKAVFRVRGNPMFTLGMHDKHAVLAMRYAQSMGSIVLDDRNIYNHENAMVTGYVGGSGCKFIDPNEFIGKSEKYYDPLHHRYPGDLFAIEVPLGYFKRSPIDLDVTGHYNTLLGETFQVDPLHIYGKPQYPLAYRFYNFWKIHGLVEAMTSRVNKYSTPNTLCSTGRTWYAGNDKDWKLEIHSKTHWGDICTRPGIAPYRNGTETSPTESMVWK